jgi:hypothetical protein
VAVENDYNLLVHDLNDLTDLIVGIPTEQGFLICN